MSESQPREGPANRWQRLGVFGDLPTRFMRAGLRQVPWFLEPVLVVMWTSLWFLVAAPQRRAVIGNLAFLVPGGSRLGTWLRAWRVFLNFAWTYMDGTRCEMGGAGVDWVIDGLRNFEDLAARREGCLILTAHMGNYDMAAPMFSGHFGRTVHAVRARERDPGMQEMRERELRAQEARHPWFRSLYNDPDSMLAVELTRVLAAGDVVAVQADRVLFDVSATETEVDGGWWMRLPRGPLVLAQATGAPCFPLFIVRDGWRRYRVRVLPRLELPRRRRGAGSEEAAAAWAEVLLRVLREEWRQWFVFEPVFRREEAVGK